MNIENWSGHRLAMIATVLLIFGIVFLINLPTSNTSYGMGWSRLGFDNLRPGDDLQRVISTLGLPWSITVNYQSPGSSPIQINDPSLDEIVKNVTLGKSSCILQYSKSTGKFGDFFWDFDVRLKNGVVKEKRHELYHEFW